MLLSYIGDFSPPHPPESVTGTLLGPQDCHIWFPEAARPQRVASQNSNHYSLASNRQEGSSGLGGHVLPLILPPTHQTINRTQVRGRNKSPRLRTSGHMCRFPAARDCCGQRASWSFLLGRCSPDGETAWSLNCCHKIHPLLSVSVSYHGGDCGDLGPADTRAPGHW